MQQVITPVSVNQWEWKHTLEPQKTDYEGQEAAVSCTTWLLEDYILGFIQKAKTQSDIK